MSEMELWEVTSQGPQRLERGRIAPESQLEDWIEGDPSLLRPMLTVVGRQMRLEGGILDLLAVDPQGRLVVIELKGGQLRRETLGQVIDYKSSVARMPWDELRRKVQEYLRGRGNGTRAAEIDELLGGEPEDGDAEREVEACIVGTGAEPGLQRMVRHLSDGYNVPISVILFSTYELGDGRRLLARELAQTEGDGTGPRNGVQRILALADRQGMGGDFRTLLAASERHGLPARPYKRSIMVTPPSDRTRMLFTVRVPTGKQACLHLWVYPPAFASFFSTAEEEVRSILGAEERRDLDPGDAAAFAAALDRFFERVEASG